MHQNRDVAPTSSVRSALAHGLLTGTICLGSLIAGATLIIMALPDTWLSAGATQSGRMPETVLLDFTAKWCSPCQEMSPIIDRLAEQGYPVMKVDVDQQRTLTERFRIDAMPTFVLLVNGREVMRQTGATSEAQLRRMLLQIPTWQQEFARQDAQQKATRTASSETTPSPFSIDLGEAQPAAPVFAENKPKRGFGGLPLPFMNRNKEKAEAVAAAQEPAIVRGQSGEARVAPVSTSDPMSASTRLRVKDAAGINYGSGTILESRVGRTLILTCGHIFRHLEDKGVVEVELFLGGEKPVLYIGKVLHFDLDSDVGLVEIPTTDPLSVISLASINEPLQVGDSLRSVGCSGGDNPSVEVVEVTSVNKYDGPDNIECTGLPVPGRSGGGLFRGRQLVGVCIAADPKDRRGVYTGLDPIYDLLEQTGFGHLLPVGRPATLPQALVAETTSATTNAATATTPPAAKTRTPSIEVADPAALFAGVTTKAQAANPAAVAQELQTVLGQAPDSEIICIVRPKNPQIPSRVVVIHEASPKLVSYLLDSVGSLPDSPGSMNEVLARSEGLVPTSAVDTVSPFAPVEFEAAPKFPERENRLPPQRPASPRGF